MPPASGESPPWGFLQRLDSQRQVIPLVVEVFQFHRKRLELMVELFDPLRLLVDLRFAEDQLILLLLGLQGCDPFLGGGQLLPKGRGRP
jgi:hypothetical protein